MSDVMEALKNSTEAMANAIVYINKLDADNAALRERVKRLEDVVRLAVEEAGDEEYPMILGSSTQKKLRAVLEEK